MPQQATTNIENNFTGGLKTDFTGLNFPENACTDVDNCVLSTTGEITRRLGIDFETTPTSLGSDRTGRALRTYKWRNVAGNGSIDIVVSQIGFTLHFYRITDGGAVSGTYITSLDLTPFAIGGATLTFDTECQFSDGNGYLFVFHPGCDPVYCSYAASVVTAHRITLNIRDITGVTEAGVLDSTRPTSLTAAHSYNLINQGWGKIWSTTSASSNNAALGAKTYTVSAGLPIVAGDLITAYTTAGTPTPVNVNIGLVTSYIGTTLIMNVTKVLNPAGPFTAWTIHGHPNSPNYWFLNNANYPANADAWWNYRNAGGAFDPTVASDKPSEAAASLKGTMILNPFNQQRSTVSGIAGISDVTTTARPSNGTWFQGRVWYAGVESPELTETIFFSQVIETVEQFGKCYQKNDPTSEDFFDLLPTDGGTISIQGSGPVYKLKPIQNGLLVFAVTGIWFITGSQGIGFAANDYTITKISSIQVLSASSFVDVEGFPIFWNEEGIYAVSPSPQGGGLVVNNLCQNTISNFFSTIPTASKKFARGDYSPLDFTIKWVYRSTASSTVTDRYEFDRVLNFDTSLKAFYPYSLSLETDNQIINDVLYLTFPRAPGNSPPKFKYLVSYLFSPGNYGFTFAEEKDEDYIDFASSTRGSIPYVSYFLTGYKTHGQGIRKFQPNYLYMFQRTDVPTAYTIQGIWDFANSELSNRFSLPQTITSNLSRFSTMFRKHKIRGHGLTFQIKITSVDGLPFNIIGWTMQETQNQSM